jgi:tetratricopeptide (TPR) repeat protein
MIRQVSFIISLLLVLSGTASGQDWLKLYEESIAYYNSESYEEALQSGENALVRYKREAELDHVNYRAMLRQLSVTAYALDNMALAVDYAKQEVESWRSATTVEEATYIDALDNLGVMYTGSGNFQEAIKVLSESLDLARNSNEKQPDEKALIEGHLALAEYGAGDLNNSKQHFQSAFKVLDQLEELPGDYINFCYSYGIVCIELSEYGEAISYLTLLFQWYDETELFDLIINANVGLGTAYTNTNELTKGEKYYLLAIKGLEQTLEPSASIIIETKKQLAHNLELQGRSDDANALLAEISSAVLADGEASESQALFLNSQATALLNTGDVAAALTTYRQALDMLKLLDLQSSEAYTTIGLNAVKAYDRDDKLLEANELATELLAVQTDESIQYYQVVAELGSILRRQGDFAAAKEQFELITNADRSSWPGNVAGQILNKTASFYQIEGSYSVSADLYLEALASPGVEDDLTLYQSILFNYVTLLQAQSRFEEAEILLAELNNSIGDDKPEIKLGLLRNLGSLALAKGDYSTATAQFNEALALAETIETR